MALIKCPECGKEMSDQALTCPNCGFELRKSEPVNWTAVFVVLIVIAVIVWILSLY